MNRFDISSELGKLRRLLTDSMTREDQAKQHITSLETALALAQDENDQYRAWFTNHQFVVTPRPEPIVDENTFYHPKELSTVAPFTATE